ncbi:MAG: hypothetical protein JXR51_12955 [Bacteroidales bacterium]|nr:hypothetical protein [Bacteroidales bacterium]
MEISEIKKAFEDFNRFNVLIVGDVMIDTYFWGKVDRISPEAPVPIIARSKVESRLGGAGNVVINIKSLGANPILCSVIGNDDKSKVLLELLDKREVSKEGIICHDSRITTVKTRIISDNHHLLRVDEEINTNINQELENELIARIKNIISNNKIDAIIFEDYDKGVITAKIIEKVVEFAKSGNIPTLVDPKKRNFMQYKGVTLFKPNFKELVEGLKLDIVKKDFEGLHNAAKKLQKELDIQIVMTTLSELGVYISDNGDYYHVPAEVRDIADVSGAGDTVISTASLCLAAGFSANDIAKISNLAGGIVCEKVGVVPIDKHVLLTECIKSYQAL